MSVDDDGDPALRRFNSLQTRLQGSMNLQVCFLNEAAAEQDAAAGYRRDDPSQDGRSTSSRPDVIPRSISEVTSPDVSVNSCTVLFLNGLIAEFVKKIEETVSN